MRPATKTQAERELRRILGEVEKGEHQDDRRGSVTFDAFFEDWLTLRELEVKPSTYKNLQSIHRAVLSPTFGPKKINAITRKSVDLWWAKHKVHPVQRRNSYFALKGAMDQAVDWGLITVSPCQVKHPGKDESKDRPTWSVEEFDAVLAHVPEFYRPVILIMFAGHLRLGEVIALNWSDVTREGVVTVTKQKTGLGFTADTKTGQHKRIQLLQRGVDALQTLPGGFGSTPFLLESVPSGCRGTASETHGRRLWSWPVWRISVCTIFVMSDSAWWPKRARPRRWSNSAPVMRPRRVRGDTCTRTPASTRRLSRRSTRWSLDSRKAVDSTPRRSRIEIRVSA
ncbi:tyrosine-type recombinase/integrase family protein [Microbacterium sp. CFBP 8794]|nr:site-specific integrase [Microbacterium sp. CFBP 8794]MBD8477694.1 tyrosine-type recombinase/integrase family protein [Microbacterium sp. CFBP 8794]